jgi:quercetin dioxygenase-like cupin family protein
MGPKPSLIAEVTMRLASFILAGSIVLAGPVSVIAGDGHGHVMVTPAEIVWKPAPKALPPGAMVAVLYGDPGKEGAFAMRLKFPAGYAVPPHTHPVNEVVTVISGAGKMGMGTVADRNATKTLPAGSFFALPTGTAHYVFYDEESVVQITTNGPWGISYVNPKDDPRNAQ